jgi:hypothetical protein
MLAERRAERWAGDYRSSRGGDLYFVPWPKIGWILLRFRAECSDMGLMGAVMTAYPSLSKWQKTVSYWYQNSKMWKRSMVHDMFFTLGRYPLRISNELTVIVIEVFCFMPPLFTGETEVAFLDVVRTHLANSLPACHINFHLIRRCATTTVNRESLIPYENRRHIMNRGTPYTEWSFVVEGCILCASSSVCWPTKLDYVCS